MNPGVLVVFDLIRRMDVFFPRTFGLALVWGLALASPQASLAQSAAPLTYAAALDIARQRAPDLVAQAARMDASRATVIPADALPDPKAFIGIDNFPVSGPNGGSLTADFMTMRKLGVMQDVLNTAKRHARKQAAEAALERESVQLRLDRRQVLRETAGAWVDRYYIEKRFTLLDELEQENRLFGDVVKAQIAAGKALPADTVLPRQEWLEIEDRRDALRRLEAEATARLSRWIGEPAQAALAGEAPRIPLDHERLKQHVQVHPELAIFEPMRRLAEAELSEAKAATRPDWGVEFAYARRDEEFGDMVSLQFNVDLPVFTAQRQTPRITAKRHELDRVEAERQAMERMHGSALESQLAEHTMLANQLNRLRTQGVPLAREKVDLQVAAYRAGTGTLNAVLEARREWINQRLKAIEWEGQRDTLAAQLQIFYGDETP